MLFAILSLLPDILLFSYCIGEVVQCPVEVIREHILALGLNLESYPALSMMVAAHF